MHWRNYQLVLSSLFAFTLQLADGCGRTPARPKPTPSTPRPNKLTHAPTPPTTYRPNQHQLKCDKGEVTDAGCFNGGECFVLDILEMRTAHCRCPEMWVGTRCEQLNGQFFPVIPADQVQLAGIATGVGVVVLILTIIIVFLIVRKRRERLERQRDRNQNNGYVCKSLIQDGGNVEYAPYDRTITEKSETNV